MRLFGSPLLFSAFVVALTSLSGCTLDPTVDGLELHPRLPYASKPVSIGEETWNGEAISIDVERGNIEIVGQPSAKTIAVRANTYTWADNQDDASAMRAATIATAKLERDERGNWRVSCSIPKDSHGSALPEATQCNVRIDLPAAEGVVHDVHAIAHFGDIYLNRLQSSATTRILASGVEVTGTVLRGNVEIYSDWADVEVEPRAGGNVLVASETGDWYYLPSLQAVEKRDERDGAAKYGATLRIPQSFTSRLVSLSSVGASVEKFDFPDVVPGMPRGPVDATSAQAITVVANQGNATLLAWGKSFTQSRQGDFSTDGRVPWTDPQP